MKVKTNALDFALRACLLQKHSEIWHPVAYYSQKMTPPKLNYNIYNKKLLNIIVALKEQRVFLQSTKKLFIVKTNHKNLIGFLIIKDLNQKQIKWAEIFVKYHFEIEHIKRSDNARANAFNKKKLQKKTKYWEHCLKKTKMGRLNTIIHNYQ